CRDPLWAFLSRPQVVLTRILPDLLIVAPTAAAGIAADCAGAVDDFLTAVFAIGYRQLLDRVIPGGWEQTVRDALPQNSLPRSVSTRRSLTSCSSKNGSTTSIGNSIKRAPEGHSHNQGCSKYPACALSSLTIRSFARMRSRRLFRLTWNLPARVLPQMKV